MRCIVRVEVRLKEGFLDPEGEVTKNALKDLGFQEVNDVKVAKTYYITLSTDNVDKIREIVVDMCRKLLANPTKDIYSIEIIKCE